MAQHMYEPKTRYEPLGAVEVVRNGHNPLGGSSESGVGKQSWKGEWGLQRHAKGMWAFS